MRKFVLVVFIFACVLFVMAVSAQDIKGKFGVGYRYGFVHPDDADYKTNGNAHNLNLTYGLSDNLALEGETGYFRLKSKAGTEVGVYSLFTSMQFRLNLDKFVPYLVGGIGLQYYDYDNLGEGDREDNKFSFAYRFGTGLEYFLKKNLSINGELVYVYGNTGGDATLDVYGWQYCAGAKFYF